MIANSVAVQTADKMLYKAEGSETGRTAHGFLIMMRRRFVARECSIEGTKPFQPHDQWKFNVRRQKTPK